MYDYYLGGKDNYPADRAAAERVISIMPAGVVRTSAVQNRKFLIRVVRHLAADLGIRQFLGRSAQLDPIARDRVGQQLVAQLRPFVSPPPPPGTPGWDRIAPLIAELAR